MRRDDRTCCSWATAAIVALALCCLFAACSEDHVGPRAPLMISDVGEHTGSFSYPDGVVEIYRFRQVMVYQDMLVSEFDEVMTRTPAVYRLGDTEVVIEVVNFRTYPASVTTGRHFPDIELKTCAQANYVDCGGGAVYHATVGADSITVADSGLMWIRR